MKAGLKTWSSRHLRGMIDRSSWSSSCSIAPVRPCVSAMVKHDAESGAGGVLTATAHLNYLSYLADHSAQEWSDADDDAGLGRSGCLIMASHCSLNDHQSFHSDLDSASVEATWAICVYTYTLIPSLPSICIVIRKAVYLVMYTGWEIAANLKWGSPRLYLDLSSLSVLFLLHTKDILLRDIARSIYFFWNIQWHLWSLIEVSRDFLSTNRTRKGSSVQGLCTLSVVHCAPVEYSKQIQCQHILNPSASQRVLRIHRCGIRRLRPGSAGHHHLVPLVRGRGHGSLINAWQAFFLEWMWGHWTVWLM